MTSTIPQPRGVPLLGNIFNIDPSNTWTSLQKLWEQYGEIFKITVLGQQIVFVGNVALCEELCDEKRFRKFVGGPIVEIRYAVHDSLFTAFDNEPSWGIHHRILSPLLTPASVAEHFTEIRDCALELTAKWRSMSNQAAAKISPIDELNRLDIETTTLCFYGRKLNNITGPESPMIKAMDGATSEAIKRPTRPWIINRLFYQSKFARDTKAMRTYAADTLAYRKANPTDRKDMLHAMINGKDPETGSSLTESQILDEIITMPIGSSTAPCVVASALYYLLQTPACLAKAREELDATVPNSEAFSHADVAKLPYITAIIRETLRLSAAAPGFNIEPIPGSKNPVTLSNGKISVPATQTLIIVLHGVNRDPAVFPSPHEFAPERMLDGSKEYEGLPAGAKKWFGNGKRACIGREYAVAWCVVVLAVLLREIEVGAVGEGGQGVEGLKQDGWFNLRPVGFEVGVKGR